MAFRHKRKKPEGRDDLTGEHRLGDAGQIIIALIFGAIWMLDSSVLHYTTVLNQYVPVGVRIPLGVLFLIISGYLSKSGLSIVFGEKREKSVVIRKGVFNVVRHPIYLGEILVYLGLLLLNISLAAVVVWIVAIFFLHYLSRHEEKLLLARFGEDYEKYMAEVPMWVPRLWRPLR